MGHILTGTPGNTSSCEKVLSGFFILCKRIHAGKRRALFLSLISLASSSSVVELIVRTLVFVHEGIDLFYHFVQIIAVGIEYPSAYCRGKFVGFS